MRHLCAKVVQCEPALKVVSVKTSSDLLYMYVCDKLPSKSISFFVSYESGILENPKVIIS